MKTKEQIERRLITLKASLEEAERRNVDENTIEIIKQKIAILEWVLAE